MIELKNDWTVIELTEVCVILIRENSEITGLSKGQLIFNLACFVS